MRLKHFLLLPLFLLATSAWASEGTLDGAGMPIYCPSR